MTAYLTAAARTPWIPRHGVFAAGNPLDLVAAALQAALTQRGLDPSGIDRLIVACDTGVGAQALNLGRRAALHLGWSTVPALTVDGQGVGDLAAIALGAAAEGSATLVAAVDLTSAVPPGAALVRDYGRPTLDEPDSAWLEQQCTAAGLTRPELDRAVATSGEPPDASLINDGLAEVAVGTTTVSADAGTPPPDDPTDLMPLAGEHGTLTAAHEAPLADGAAAVLIESRPSTTQPTSTPPTPNARPIVEARTTADHPDTILDRLRIELTQDTALAEAQLAVHKLVGAGTVAGISNVAQLGSTPSGDGLRMLVDGFHAHPGSFGVVRRGRHGQLAVVRLGSRD